MIQFLAKISVDEDKESINVTIGEEDSTASDIEKEVFELFRDAIYSTVSDLRDAVFSSDKE